MLELRIVAQRIPGETTYESVRFTLTIKACINVQKSTTVKTYNDIKYTVGDPLLALSPVVPQNLECHNSYLAVEPDPLPAGFSVSNSTQTKQIIVQVEAESSQVLQAG